MLVHKSGNISETRKNRGKVTMESLEELTSYTLSGGTIPDPLRPKFVWLPHIISGTGKATDFKFRWYVHRVHPYKSPLRILEKKERGQIRGLPKCFE